MAPPPAATETNGSAAPASKTGSQAIPFQGQQPFGMADDLVIPNIMNIEDTDERLWVSIYLETIAL